MCFQALALHLYLDQLGSVSALLSVHLLDAGNPVSSA